MDRNLENGEVSANKVNVPCEFIIIQLIDFLFRKAHVYQAVFLA